MIQHVTVHSRLTIQACQWTESRDRTVTGHAYHWTGIKWDKLIMGQVCHRMAYHFSFIFAKVSLLSMFTAFSLFNGTEKRNLYFAVKQM